MSKEQTRKKLSPSIRHDPINPKDYNALNLPWSCEDCTHFNSENKSCTIGYQTHWHLKSTQQKSYELSGKMALCRFQEID